MYKTPMIYLAGKISPTKWEFAKEIKSNYGDIFDIEASDKFGSGHDTFEITREAVLNPWKDLSGRYGDYEPFVKVVHYGVCNPISECDLLIAYIDTPDCYGTIAEIAYASGSGKRSLIVFADHTFSEENTGLCPYTDTYGLVCGFKNVSVYHLANREKQWDTQVSAYLSGFLKNIYIRMLNLCESPIEEQLLKAVTGEIDDESLCKYEFTNQYDIPEANTRLDFTFLKPKIAIYCDGHAYHSNKKALTKDRQQDRKLSELGWTVLRYTGTEIHNNADKVANEIKRRLSHGTEGET